MKRQPNTACTRRVGVAAFSSSFLRLSIFLAGRLRRPRPSAGIPLAPLGDDGANR
jgi:hypothetical protein